MSFVYVLSFEKITIVYGMRYHILIIFRSAITMTFLDVFKAHETYLLRLDPLLNVVSIKKQNISVPI